MKDNKKIILTIVVIVIAIIGILYFANGTPGNDKIDNKITCTTTLSNYLFSDVQIETNYCIIEGQCNQFFSIQSFSIFGDKGNLVIEMEDGAKKTASYDLDEGTTRTYETTLCSQSITGTIKTYDDEGGIISSQSLTVVQ